MASVLRIRWVARTAVVALITAGSVLSCSPAMEEGGWVAMRLHGSNQIEILPSICPNEVISSYGIFTQGRAVDASWLTFAPRAARGGTPTPPETLTFDSMPGWKTEIEGDIFPLDDNVEYGVAVASAGHPIDGGGTRTRRAGFNFTLGELSSLADDEVLVATSSLEGKVMLEKDFERISSRSCGG